MKKIVIALLTSLIAGLTGLTIWMLFTWQHISIQELVFYITNDVGGADKSLFINGGLSFGIPFIIVIIISRLLAGDKQVFLLIAIIIIFVLTLVIAGIRLDAFNYFSSSFE